MSTKRHIKRLYNKIFSIWEIPKDLKNTNETKILHISDTPRSIHKKIIELVLILNPEIIIHTGDLVDDIKLEFKGWEINRYEKYANRFLKNLNDTGADNIYIVPGNHDRIDVLTKFDKINIVKSGSIINLNGWKLSLAHRSDELSYGGDYYLFGHNFEPYHHVEEEKTLNGVESISVLLLPSERRFTLGYPWFTNHDRKYFKFKKIL